MDVQSVSLADLIYGNSSRNISVPRKKPSLTRTDPASHKEASNSSSLVATNDINNWQLSEDFLKDHSSSAESNAVDAVWMFATQDELELSSRALGIDGNGELNDKCEAEYGFLYRTHVIGRSNVAFITQTEMGMVETASLSARAIIALRPKLVVMSGICGGRPGKTKLGDIVIAKQVYDYSAGKRKANEFAPRPQPVPLPNGIKTWISNCIIQKHDDIANYIAKKWHDGRDTRSNIYFKVMGSGAAVVDDEKTFEEATRHQDDLYAVEMEAYGLAVSANALNVDWVVAKGVQDFANGRKSSDEKDARAYSAFASAVVMRVIVDGYCGSHRQSGLVR